MFVYRPFTVDVQLFTRKVLGLGAQRVELVEERPRVKRRSDREFQADLLNSRI
ncbi:hypothetical protein D3C75_1386840 [compost metagenome]